MDATKVASEPLAVRRLKYLCGNDDDDNSLLSDADLANCDNVFRETALEEKCGVFGCISNGDWPTSLDVAHIICLGLVGLQHRGQESAGIVTCKYKSEPFSVSRAEGLVSSAFSEYSMMSLKGNLGVGHTRYSTTGGSGNLQLAQPFVVHTSYGTIAVSHNGELVNSSVLRKNLLDNGVGLTTGSDSELIIQCLSQPPPKEFRHPRIRKQLEKERGEQQQYYNNQYNNNVITGQQTTNNNGTINHSEAENVTTRSRSGSELSLKSSSSKAYQKRVDSGASENERIPLWKSELTREEDEITSRLLHLMSVTPVSYSLIIMFNECIYACRDSFGNRPLTIGMLVPPPYAGDHGDMPWSIIDNCLIEGWCISSESCSFPSIHAKLKRDVEPGEIVKFERNSKIPKTLAIMPRPPEAISPAFCIFEYVYFARPDSILEKQTIYAVRMKCGRRLAIESPATTSSSDLAEFIVAPVPESSIPAALGYAQESKLPYVEVFCKNRYVGRTFIQPSIRLRRLGVAKKFGPLTENCLGKSIILIDDSIVRGTTIGQLVRLLKEAGAKEVHIRIASPPLHFPCYMGINIPTKEELIANHLTPDEFALNLGAASLKYLSIEGLKESVQSGIIDKLKLEKSRNLGPQGASAKPANLGLNGAPKPGISTSSVAVAVAKPSSPVVEKATVENNTSKTDQQQDNDLLTDKEIQSKVGHCLACLTGEYPVALEF